MFARTLILFCLFGALHGASAEAAGGHVRLVVLGDSLAVGLGMGLQALVDPARVTVEPHGKVSAGLGGVGGGYGAGAYAVILVGTNESSNMSAAGVQAGYAKRLLAAAVALRNAGMIPVLVGPPSTGRAGGLPGNDRDMAGLNEVYREVAAAGGFIYVDLRTPTTVGGHFAPTSWKGQPCHSNYRSMSDGGVHFSGVGYQLIGAEVLRAIEAHAGERLGRAAGC